jgi:hypothetical protein
MGFSESIRFKQRKQMILPKKKKKYKNYPVTQGIYLNNSKFCEQRERERESPKFNVYT